MKEAVTLVDDQDNIVGSKDRDLLSNEDQWRIVTIWLENSNDEVLLAKRSLLKKNNPGKWGPAAAGTVQHGDSYHVTAERELQEELGVTVSLTEVGLHFHRSMMGGRADMCYKGHTDLKTDEFTLQEEEVEEVAWIDKNELREHFRDHPGEYIQEFDVILGIFTSNQRGQFHE